MSLNKGKVCNAKSKRDGQPCRNIAVNGSDKCRMHGGKSPKGIASPSFKTGETSKYAYLPKRLSEKVETFLNDPALVELKENIAILDARLSELYQNFHESEPADVWRGLVSRFSDWQTAIEFLDKLKDEELRKNQIERIEDLKKDFTLLLKNGASEQSKAERLWNEILSVTEQRRKLVESESKRLKDQQQMITSEQFMTFIQTILSIIKENVTDRQTLNNISESFIKHQLVSTRVN